jgi:hypothetical protein
MPTGSPTTGVKEIAKTAKRTRQNKGVDTMVRTTLGYLFGE